MANELITRTRLILSYNTGSYSYSNLSADATDEQLHELARALNSVQSRIAEKVYKQVTVKLTED